MLDSKVQNQTIFLLHKCQGFGYTQILFFDASNIMKFMMNILFFSTCYVFIAEV